MSEQVEVSAKTTLDNNETVEGTVVAEFPSSVDEAVQMYGEDFVKEYLHKQLVLKYQGDMRREMQAGTAPEALSEKFSDYDVTQKHKTQGDVQEQAKRDFAKKSPEEQQQYLAELQEILNS